MLLRMKWWCVFCGHKLQLPNNWTVHVMYSRWRWSEVICCLWDSWSFWNQRGSHWQVLLCPTSFMHVLTSEPALLMTDTCAVSVLTHWCHARLLCCCSYWCHHTRLLCCHWCAWSVTTTFGTIVISGVLRGLVMPGASCFIWIMPRSNSLIWMLLIVVFEC